MIVQRSFHHPNICNPQQTLPIETTEKASSTSNRDSSKVDFCKN